MIAVDASAGMLAEAEKLVRREGWQNVELIHRDATKLELDTDLDGVLFSLSYSVLPNRGRRWRSAGTGSARGRVVVMDLGLTGSRFHRLLAPIGWLLERLAPGDAYSEPWDDLRACGEVETERFLLGFYYVSTVTK